MKDSQNDGAEPEELPPECEEAIEQFEQLWLAGASPSIESFLPKAGDRLSLLTELLIAELEFRIKSHEQVSLADYLSRFPELTSHPQAFLRIAREEFRIRRRHGDQTTAREFASQYSELAPDLLNQLSAESAPTSFFVERISKPPIGIGAELGSRLSEFKWLAKGGMGEVWIAQDQTLKRQVAIKVIQQKYERNAEALRRFVAEAEITSRLENPGIAPVYGLGEHADGRPCYAMRFVRGESMGDAVRRFFQRDDNPGGVGGVKRSSLAKRNRLDLHQARRNLVFRGLLQRLLAVSHTVAYAHKHRVLHRDLKPENIRLGEHGETILLDWGLAKNLSEVEPASNVQKPTHLNDSAELLNTKSGGLYGTPQFMSPEQARNDGAVLTHAVDIYGLGATLYYLITGQAPFPRESPSKVVDRVIQGNFRAPRTVCRDAPAALEAICIKAMKSNPAERYASATEFAHDIECYLADQSVSVFQDGAGTRFRRWVMRNRTLAAIGATASIAVAILLLVGTIMANQHSQDLAVKNSQLSRSKLWVDQALLRQTELGQELTMKNVELERTAEAAKQAAKEAKEQQEAAKVRSEQVIALTKSLVEILGAASPEGFRTPLYTEGQSLSPSQISAPEYLDRIIAEVNEQFAMDDPARGDVFAAVGQTKRSMGLFESAVPVLAESLRIRRLHAGADDVVAAGIEFNLAWSLLEIQGRSKEAEVAFRNVIRVRHTEKPRDELALGLAQAGLLWSLYVQGKSSDELLLALGQELGVQGVLHSVSIAKLFIDLRDADLARATRDWKKGDQLFQQVSEVIDQLVPPEHPFLAARDFTVAGYLRDRGDMRAAQEYVLRGLKIYRERVGMHTYMSDPLYHIAQYRESTGDLEEAESLQREAYWLASLNPKNLRSFRDRTLRGLCDILQKQGKHAELRRFLQGELEGPNALNDADVQEYLARKMLSFLEAGDFVLASQELPKISPKNPLLPNIDSLRCRVLFELGKFAEANAIMPVQQHLGEDDYLPREAPTLSIQLRRLSRGDDRTAAEVEASVPTEPIQRDRYDTVLTLRRLALLRMKQQDFKAAGECLAEAEEIARRRMSTVDRAFIDLLYDRVILKLAANKLAETLDDLRIATEIARTRYGKDAVTLADFLHESGLIAMYAGDLPLARSWLDECIAIREKHWNGVNARVWHPVLDRIEATPDHKERQEFLRAQIRQMSNQGVSSWRIAVLLRELGACHRQLGANQEAERVLEDAWRIFSPMLGEKHVLTQATTRELERVCNALDRAEDAEKWRKLANGE